MNSGFKNFYNIHDLAKVAVDSAAANFADHEHYLRNFETKSLESIDYVSSSKSYESVLLPMQKVLVSKGATFVHGLGVEVAKRGVIFPARGGIGKTSLMSHLRHDNNVRFYGDDFVIIDREGGMLSFPSDFSIYPYHLPLYPEIKGMAQGKYLSRRRYLFGFYFMRKAINYVLKRLGLRALMLPGWNAEYAKVPAEALIGKEKIGQKTKLYISIFLERHNGDEVTSDEITPHEAVSKILEIIKFELGLPSIEREREILTSAFAQLKCFKVSLPVGLSNEKYFEFMDNFLKKI